MNHSEKEGVASVSKRIIVAAIAGWLFLFAGVLLSALVFHIFYLPEGAIPWVSGAVTYIAGLFCGFRSARRARRKGYRNGFLAGIVFVAGYVVLTLIFQGKVQLIKSLILLVLSTIGGIFGINTKRR